MRNPDIFADSAATERRTPFSPPLKGGLRGEGPAPSSVDRESAAQWVRQHLPICAAVASAFRAVFPVCRMTYASEAGHVIGSIEAPGFTVSGANLLPIKRAKP